jgi:hypothetical protein
VVPALSVRSKAKPNRDAQVSLLSLRMVPVLSDCNAGATREEATDALGVAIALNSGAALAYSARVLDAYAAIDGAAKSAAE